MIRQPLPEAHCIWLSSLLKDTVTINDLGRWESMERVQRYTRSVTSHDSLKFYRTPLG
jgi:hypothetical protein